MKSKRRTAADPAGPKLLARIVAATKVSDVHTHLYEPAFGPLLLWGIDDLLVYHYLAAEAFRYLKTPYHSFWAMPKERQAEVIWNELFLRHSPVSEACRGVLTSLNGLGLDVRKRDLSALRRLFARRKLSDHLDQVLDAAGVRTVCMTNSPFDDMERPFWERGFGRDQRFTAALRLDPLLLDWENTVPLMRRWGYDVRPVLGLKAIAEVRRFLARWTEKIRARYVMVSLPPNFEFPDHTSCARLIQDAVLPHCRDHGLPLALMPGVRRAVNPALRLAGDGVGRSDLTALQHLCAGFPDNKFAATVLARENQHELCVLARKFRNLHIFGCWWFLNNPSLIEETTRMRLEMLGLSFTPQHSDARVLEQLVYKWQHFRSILVPVLLEKYADLAKTGWVVSRNEIERDVLDLFGGAFDRFCAL